MNSSSKCVDDGSQDRCSSSSKLGSHLGGESGSKWYSAGQPTSVGKYLTQQRTTTPDRYSPHTDDPLSFWLGSCTPARKHKESERE